jgi:glycosyltransferase involved in cell wall biosynthesis
MPGPWPSGLPPRHWPSGGGQDELTSSRMWFPVARGLRGQRFDVFTIGFVGRLVVGKGVSVLVAAAAALPGPVRVLLAGQWPEAGQS